MNRQIRGLLFLFAVAMALGGTYFWLSSSNDPEQTGVLFRLAETETVENIQLQNQYGQFQFVKEGDDWIVINGSQYRTNPEKLQLMLSNLELLPISRVLEETHAAYGLDPPRIQVAFTTSAGTENRFSVGAETASRSGVYIRDDKSGTIMITSTGVVSQLDGSLSAYRSKDVLSIEAASIRQILYFENGQPIVAASNSNFKDWMLTYPFEAPARTIPLNELVSGMHAWSIAAYPSGEETPEMGLLNPAHALEITDQNGNRQRLEFGASDGTTTYVRTGEGNEIVKLYTVDLNFSALTPNALLFIAPLKAPINEIKSVNMQYQGQQAVFELDHSVNPPAVTYNGTPLPYNDFVSVFSKYVALNADGRDPVAQPGEAIFTFTSVLTDGSQRMLQLTQRDADTYYMVLDDNALYYLEADKVEALLYRMSAFQNR